MILPDNSRLLRLFRIVGLLEALSFLALLGIAMPLKYIFGIPEASKVLGMSHGLLFIAYVLLANLMATNFGWSFKRQCLAYVSAVLPFGTLVFDRKCLSPAASVRTQRRADSYAKADSHQLS